MRKVKSEPQPDYVVASNPVQSEDETIQAALFILRRRVANRDVMTNVDVVKQYLQLRAAGDDSNGQEVFGVMFLDSQHRLITTEDLFFGTLNQTSVYPREVVKRALAWHAAAVIFTHNHPSGIAEPSRADELLTKHLKDALALVDVRVLDHIVTSGSGAVSLAERGLL